MTNREQDHEIERLSVAHAGAPICVRAYYADHVAEVTIKPGSKPGATYHVNDEGVSTKVMSGCASVDWAGTDTPNMRGFGA